MGSGEASMPSNKTLIPLIALLAVVLGFLTTAASAFAADKVRLLHSFCRVGSCPDGLGPGASLIFDSSGNLYGVASGGGAYGYGAVFQLTPGDDGKWTEKILHSFNLTNGAFPIGGLIFDPVGNLYGTTFEGGAFYTCEDYAYGCGTVFQLTPGADGKWSEKVLHSFKAQGKDGYWPFDAGVIIDAAGNLYGTTSGGGAHPLCGGGTGCGTVFRLTRSADGEWKENVLYSFSGKDGNAPYSSLILDGTGNLYGTTYQGGGVYSSSCYMNSCGVVFELTRGKDGEWTENVLHRFNGNDGSQPRGGLIFDVAGNLYGTTSDGGAYSCGGSGCGTAFQLTHSVNGTWKEKVLHNFGKGKDGTVPFAGMISDAAGNLYGTTLGGGAYGSSCGNIPCGTVFRLTPDINGQWGEEVLHSFIGVDGSAPDGSLIFDGAGNLYGAAGSGGAYGGGAVFEITP